MGLHSVGRKTSGHSGPSSLLRREFERTRRDRRNHLVLSELLKFNGKDAGLPIHNLDHLSILWALDRSKTGRVSLEDLSMFARGCEEATRGVPHFEREAAVRGACALALWRAAQASAEAPAQLGQWVGCLVAESSPERRRFWRHGVGRCVPIEALVPLHTLLRLNVSLGLGLQAFVDLLQRTAEARRLLDLRDPAQDDWVPLEVIREFARRLPGGTSGLLDDICPPQAGATRGSGREAPWWEAGASRVAASC